MKKVIISCLFVLLFLASVAQADRPIQKILSLGQSAIDRIGANDRGQFIAYDGQYATIRMYQRGYSTIRIYKDKPAYVYISNIVVKMQYDGSSDLRISYEK